MVKLPRAVEQTFGLPHAARKCGWCGADQVQTTGTWNPLRPHPQSQMRPPQSGCLTLRAESTVKTSHYTLLSVPSHTVPIPFLGVYSVSFPSKSAFLVVLVDGVKVQSPGSTRNDSRNQARPHEGSALPCRVSYAMQNSIPTRLVPTLNLPHSAAASPSVNLAKSRQRRASVGRNSAGASRTSKNVTVAKRSRLARRVVDFLVAHYAALPA